MTQRVPTAFEHISAFLCSWLSYRMSREDFAGLSVAIATRNGLQFSKAFGYASLSPREHMTTRHIFSMASQTKMVTAVLVLRLVGQKKLQLDDKAVSYLPWLGPHFDKRIKEVTVRQLLAHSSGLLRDGNEAEYWTSKKAMPSRPALRRIVLADKLVFAPGTQVKYSNLGYGLLGLIVESVYGEPYAKVAQKLFKDLKVDLFPDYSPVMRGNIPTGYGLAFNQKRQSYETWRHARSLCSVVGLYGTPFAMCTFMNELFKEDSRILSRDLQQEMQRVQSRLTTGLDAGTEFGLGVEYQILHDDERLVGHTGHMNSHISATFHDPETGVTASVAANMKDTPVVAIARGIMGAYKYFTTTVTGNEDEGRFSVRAVNGMSSIQIIDLKKKIIIIDPDDWEPFSWYEEVARVDESTLKVATKGSIYNEGEVLRYAFSKGKVKKVTMAGLSLMPDTSINLS